MQEACNTEVKQTCLQFQILYKVFITKIQGIVPVDKRYQLEMHLQRYAIKLGMGDYEKEWFYTNASGTNVVVISFSVLTEETELVKGGEVYVNFIKEVAKYKNLTYQLLQLKTKKRIIVLPRQMLMYLLKKLSPLSLSEIGNLFGNFDHATIIHASKTIQNLIDTNPIIKDEVEYIENNIATKYLNKNRKNHVSK